MSEPAYASLENQIVHLQHLIEGKVSPRMALRFLRERYLDHTRFSDSDVLFLDIMANLLTSAFVPSSQLLQDVCALYFSGNKNGGYFLEIGAADGVFLSNTLALEQQRGWTGVIVEPTPAHYANAARVRTCTVVHAAVSASPEHSVRMRERGELSTIEGYEDSDAHAANRRQGELIVVPNMQFTALVERYSIPHFVDFLSIDTEGSELQILQSIDFRTFAAGFISLEHNDSTTRREQYHDILSANGYQRVLSDYSEWDDYYVRSEAIGEFARRGQTAGNAAGR